MRNGDAYKIKDLSTSGMSDKDVAARFSRIYSADEVKKFCVKKELTPAQKGAATKKANSKKDPLG